MLLLIRFDGLLAYQAFALLLSPKKLTYLVRIYVGEIPIRFSLLHLRFYFYRMLLVLRLSTKRELLRF